MPAASEVRSDDLCCTPGEGARDSCESDAPGTAVVKGAKLKGIERVVNYFRLS